MNWRRANAIWSIRRSVGPGCAGGICAIVWLVCGSLALAQGINDVPISQSQQLPAPASCNEGLQHLAQPLDGRKTHTNGKYDVSRIGSRGIGGGMNLYSIDKELKLGRELAAETDAELQFLRDPVVNEYVNRIAQDLASHSDAKVPFTVKVVDSDEVNAFTLPGGFLYVNVGLLLASNDEAELAGVMAHEIAHVAARHATKNVTRRQLFNLASVPLLFVGGGAVNVITQVAGIAEPISFMKFNRNAEREADLLGLEYAYAAGYDPTEFVHFLERMQKISREKKTPFIIRLFSTHPMTDDRIRRAQDEVATMLPAKTCYVLTTSEFEDIKAHFVQLRATEHPVAPETPALRRRTPDEARSGSDMPPLDP